MNISTTLLYERGSIDMIGHMNALFFIGMFIITVSPALAILLGALSGYCNRKLTIPLGAVWSLFSGAILLTLFGIINGSMSTSACLISFIFALNISFNIVTSATIGSLIQRIRTTKKRLLELERQVAEHQTAPEIPQSPTPQDE